LSPRLILSADDFGAAPDVNEGILRAAREGLLRHASLMVTGDRAEEAVRRARAEAPALSLGLHAVLCAGRPALEASVRGGLAPGGRFPDDPVLCGLRYFLRPSLSPLLEAELRAQFERFLAWGLPPSHVDSHANVHAHPVLFPLLARLAREYGFRRIRLPGGELSAALAYGEGGAALADAAVFGTLRAALKGKAPGLELPDGTWGVLRSGRMDEGYFLHLLRRLPEGTTEVYFHPSADPALRPDGRRPTPLHHSCADMEALLSPRARAFIEAAGIVLV
jgi:hopanoid biosynthesis associated protein HpnK